MNEIIAYSSGDVVVEFSEGAGAFKVDVPLQALVFERESGTINGSFVVGSEFLDSQQENVFEKVANDGVLFNIRNIRRIRAEATPSPIIDAIDGISIFKSRTIIPRVPGIVQKIYYFTTDSGGAKTIEPPVDETRSINISNIGALRCKCNDPKWLRDEIEHLLRRHIG